MSPVINGLFLSLTKKPIGPISFSFEVNWMMQLNFGNSEAAQDNVTSSSCLKDFFQTSTLSTVNCK